MQLGIRGLFVRQPVPIIRNSRMASKMGSAERPWQRMRMVSVLRIGKMTSERQIAIVFDQTADHGVCSSRNASSLF